MRRITITIDIRDGDDEGLFDMLHTDVAEHIQDIIAEQDPEHRLVARAEVRTAAVHKATPELGSLLQVCAVCGEPIRSVPGGHGPTWVHTATGAVAGSGAPCG
jgi:hypothetical protein